MTNSDREVVRLKVLRMMIYYFDKLFHNTISSNQMLLSYVQCALCSELRHLETSTSDINVDDCYDLMMIF